MDNNKVRWIRPLESDASIGERARGGFWYSERFGVYIRCTLARKRPKKVRVIELMPPQVSVRLMRSRRHEAWPHDPRLEERITRLVMSAGTDLSVPQTLMLWGDGAYSENARS